jgi:hypothetical protein
MNMERMIGENMEEQLPIYFQILNQFSYPFVHWSIQ